MIPKMAVAVCVPASRAKLSMLNTMSKIRGQVKNPGYPQSEGLLGESMIRYGRELGEDSNFGECPPLRPAPLTALLLLASSQAAPLEGWKNCGMAEFCLAWKRASRTWTPSGGCREQ